ncbi:hypothetical protein ACHAQH_006522 [Verticillium albo-atrum]
MAKQTSHLAALMPAIMSNLTVASRQTPTPGVGEILVRTRVIAVNPIDWKRQAWGFMTPALPAVLGADLAGEVTEVGPSVKGFQPGDRVLAMAHGLLTGNNDNGAYQEYAVVKASTASKVPQNMPFTQAATLPTAVGTAMMMLVDVLGLPCAALETGRASASSSSPSSIFIWGGSSAVGTLAIQLAHKAGLTVYATASAKHHVRLRELGADVVVDYSSGDAAREILAASEKVGKPIAWAVDAIASEQTLEQVVRVLKGSTATEPKKLATVVPWAATLDKPQGIETQDVRGDALWDRRADLAEWLCWEALPAWLESGEIKPLQHRVVEGGLEGLQSAMDQVQKGVSGEKLVVEV